MPTKPRVTLPPAPALGADAAASEPSYLGVPDDYVTDYRGSNIINGQVQMRPDLYPVQVGPTYETDGPNTAGALAAVASLPPETLARLQIRLAKAGLISSSSKVQVGILDDVTESAYREVLSIANRYGMSDTDALAMLESRPSLAGSDLAGSSIGKGGGLSAEEKGPVTTTRTDTSVQKFTRLDAEAAADAAFQAALGQDAVDPKHTKALRAALNAYAKANPQTTETTQTVQPDGDVTSSSVSSGGITSAGAATIAQNYARARPNYGEVQAAATYFPLLEQAFDSTVDL